MEQKKTTSLFSKIFTIAFLAAVLALLIFIYVLLGAVKDFTKPISFKIDQNTYDYTIDEFVEFLIEKDYMKDAPQSQIGIDGITEARKYGDTYVLYWDVNSMDENSEDYQQWKTYSNIGNMTLGDAEQTRLVVYGCFAVSYKEKEEGATEETYKVLEKFPMEYSGNHGNRTAWDCTFDEFADYMIQLGYFHEDREDRTKWITMSIIGTENWIVNGIDVIWWDVDHLVEGTEPYDYWTQMQENGYMIFGGQIYMPTLNGPFGIFPTAKFPGNTEQLLKDFMNFPKGYTPAE